MSKSQSGILATVPSLARYLTFSLVSAGAAHQVLAAMKKLEGGDSRVIGLGQSLLLALDVAIEEMREFPARSAAAVEVPATPAALWCWLRGSDRGSLLHEGRALATVLAPAFQLRDCIDAFKYDGGRDLTGYEDGTENPEGDAALEAAIVTGSGDHLEGSSFVAVQRWVHDLDGFDSRNTQQQDHIIGRRRRDNEELDDAPVSAHVKRTAQESFEPPAFVLRRSMPWANETEAGLVFVAFGKSFNAFEALLQRMTGGEDGITDALFTFTHPVSGGYYWCPPAAGDGLDLGLLGIKG